MSSESSGDSRHEPLPGSHHESGHESGHESPHESRKDRPILDEPPPFLGTWQRVYRFVLLFLAAVILLFWLFTKHYAPPQI